MQSPQSESNPRRLTLVGHHSGRQLYKKRVTALFKKEHLSNNKIDIEMQILCPKSQKSF